LEGREARDTRTVEDLVRAVRSLTRHFNTDTIVIVGSQAVLLFWPDAPVLMRTSNEIDAYPENYGQWEASNPGELASEEINAFFGYGSQFHQQFGFFIDGVDETTATLPPGWRSRAKVLEIDDGGRRVRAVAPQLDDLLVAKLHRLREKDRAFIAACHEARPLDIDRLKELMGQCASSPEIKASALAFLDRLSRDRIS